MLQGGQEAGSWFRIDRPVTTIGRHPESDIFLNDVTVSRRHAEILYTDGEFHLKDVGSLNGREKKEKIRYEKCKKKRKK